jgi:hypothetical protein
MVVAESETVETVFVESGELDGRLAWENKGRRRVSELIAALLHASPLSPCVELSNGDELRKLLSRATLTHLYEDQRRGTW